MEEVFAVEGTPLERLLLAAVDGGLDRLMRTAGELLDCPLLLGDTLLNVLAWTGEPLEGNAWDDFIAAGWAPDFHAPPPSGPAPLTLAHGFTLTFVSPRQTGGWDGIVDVDLGRGLTAHLILAGLSLPQTEEGCALIDALCLSIRGLLRPDRTAPTRQLSVEQLLLPLLHGETPDESTLRFRAKLVGLEAEGEFALLLVDLRGYHPVRTSISTVCALLQETVNGPYAIDAETLILLAQRQNDSIWPAVSALLAEHGLEGVYTAWFYRLADAPRAYLRGRRSLALRGCARTPAPLLSCQSLSVHLLASQTARDNSWMESDEPILLRLAEADKNSKSAYLDTLAVYLECAQRPAAACAALHIHRNTLDYRLRRMETLIPIDWGDGNLMFRLYFGLCVLRHQQLNPGGPSA